MPDTRAAQTSATGNTLKKLAAAEPTRRYCEVSWAGRNSRAMTFGI
jgi:hypothetical protein